MENEIDQLLEVIDNIIDISNYVNNYPKFTKINGGLVSVAQDDWSIMKKQIDQELTDRGLLTNDEHVLIHFDVFGKLNKIEKILDVYEQPKEEEFEFENDDCEIHVKKTDSITIKCKTVIKYTLTENEWKNYKRTKIIDKMLDGTGGI